jgi:hypothetical protein
MPALLLKSSPDLPVRWGRLIRRCHWKVDQSNAEILETSTVEWNWYQSVVVGGVFFVRGERAGLGWA